MSALAIVSPAAAAEHPQPTRGGLTLYELTVELTCWLDSRAMTDRGSPERADCDRAVEEFTAQLADRVDAVGWMLAHLESQIELAKQEVTRLKARQEFFESSLECLETYCVHTLEQLPEPKKGARKLEGAACTLSLRKSDGVILSGPAGPGDESLVPLDYKTATVKLPARTWGLLANLHPQILEAVTYQKMETRLSDVKRALKAGEAVSGADLEFRNNLQRK